MRLASANLVERLQSRVKDYTFGDSAYVLIDEQTGTDEYNVPTTTTVAVPIDCSFTDKVSTEAWSGFADVENINAEIRFNGVTPLKGYRVRVASRFGDDAYHDRDFEIVGIKDRGVFGYVCALKAVSL